MRHESIPEVTATFLAATQTQPPPLLPLSSEHVQPLQHPAALTASSTCLCSVSLGVAATATLQKQKNIAGALAFWMANASELLNFIKQDRDLSRVTLDAQDILAHLVQMAFKSVFSFGHVFVLKLLTYKQRDKTTGKRNSLFLGS